MLRSIFYSTSVFSALIAVPAHGATLLFDNFSTSDGQNLNFSHQVGSSSRQTGLYANTAYLDTHAGGGNDFRTQVNEPTFGETGFFFPVNNSFSGSTKVTPNRNFNTDGSIVTVSANLLTQSSASGGDFISLKIGASNPQEDVNSGSGLTLAIRPWQILGNNYEIYYGSTLLQTGNNSAITGTNNLVELGFNTSAFDNSSATVTVKVNSTIIYTNTLTTGFTGNYVTVQAADLTSAGSSTFFGVDNLTISAVPEPISLAMIGLIGFGLMRRQR